MTRCLETIAVVKGRRGQELTEAERELFRRQYEEGGRATYPIQKFWRKFKVAYLSRSRKLEAA